MPFNPVKKNDISSQIKRIKFPFVSYFEDEEGLAFMHKRQWQYLALFILAFIWGSSFILMKKGLETFNASQVAALRIFLSFIFFMPFIMRRLKKLKRQNIIYILIVGFIGNAIPAILFTTGQTELSSSLAGILNSLTPLFTLLVGLTIFRISTGWKNIAGLILGLIGTAGLIINGSNHFISGNLWYVLLIIGATLCYAISVNTIKEKLKGIDGLSISVLAFLMIGPFAGIYLIFSDIGSAFEKSGSMDSLKYIIYLAFFSSFLAVTLFNTLIKYTSSVFASSVTYVIPIFAVIWGMLDGESVTYLQFIWMLLILLGVYLVNIKVIKQ